MLTPKIYLTGFHDICTVVTSKQVIDGLSAGCGLATKRVRKGEQL